MKKYLLTVTCIPFLVLPGHAEDQQENFLTLGSASYTAWPGAGRDREGSAPVLMFKSPDQKTIDETAEDLNVMSVVFSQNLERALGAESGDGVYYKLGIPMLLQTGGRPVEPSYIEGFGAVFNLKVPFPLVPPATAREDAKTSQMNSEWEQARRALAEGARGGSVQGASDDNSGRFNPKLVEMLKKRVLELLRNASNLRHVQPDEWVAVSFEGPPNGLNRRNGIWDGAWGVRRNFFRSSAYDAFASGTGTTTIQNKFAPTTSNEMDASSSGAAAGQGTSNPSAQSAGQPGDPSTGAITAFGSASGTAGQAKKAQSAAAAPPERMTLMTIRVKKRDVDAFAADKLTEEQFFHAAEVIKYLGPVIGNDGASEDSGLMPR
jgi:hypothetical protein